MHFWLAVLLAAAARLPSQANALVPACPCWPTPAEGSGCNSTQLLQTTNYTEFGTTVSFKQCVNPVAYDAAWGALQVSLCWNEACLPEPFLTRTRVTEIELGPSELQGMGAATYTVNFNNPPALGPDGVITRAVATKAGQVAESLGGTNGTLIVPQSGLEKLNIQWEWPPGLVTGNQASVVLQLVNRTQYATTEATASSSSLNVTCSDVEVIGRAASGSFCANSTKARLWVTAGNTGFLGLTNQNSNPGPDGLAALRCVDKPAYDQYTQLLTWSVDWNFTCWENSTALPFVMALAELERLSVGFPRSARVYLYVRGGLKYQPLQDGFPILVPFTSIRASNPPFFDGNGPVTVQRSTSDEVFKLPRNGTATLSLAVQLRGSNIFTPGVSDLAKADLSNATFRAVFASPVPQLQGGIDAIRDGLTVIEWNATMSIPGQVLDTAGNWPIPLGLRARVQSLGWGLTIPVLLRSLDLLPAPTTNTTNNTNTATNTTTAANECSGARVDAFLLRVASVSGLNRTRLNATCTLLDPGTQANLLASMYTSTTEYLTVGTTSITTGVDDATATIPGSELQQCGDARMALMVTYNAVLPADLRPSVAQVPLPTDEELTTADTVDQGATPITPITTTRPPLSINTRVATHVADIRRAVGRALAGVPSDKVCISDTATVSTLMSVANSLATGKAVANATEPDGTASVDKICKETVANAVADLRMFLGQEAELDVQLVHVVNCVGKTNCVDCWPYKWLTVWQLVLAVTAAMVGTAGLLWLRLELMHRLEGKQVVRPGVLDDENTALRVMMEQQQQNKEAAAAQT